MTTEEKIMRALEEVKQAGHGEVEVKVADHKIVSWKYEAQFQLTKQERGKHA